MYRRVSPFVALIVFLGPLPTAAQRGAAGSGLQIPDIVELKIRVRFPNNTPAPMHLRVQLLSGIAMYVAEKLTDSAGEANFSHVEPGTYRLKISGEGIEDTTTDIFTVQRRENSHYEIVQVQPKQSTAQAGRKLSSATVASIDLNVPEKARNEFERGTQAFGQKDWAAARKHLQQAIAFYPQYAAAYNNLGVAFVNSGDLESARTAFEKAILLNQSFGPAHVNLAKIYYSAGQFQNAEILLERSLSFEPLNVEALLLLANAQLLLGKLDDAILNARKVHTLPHHGYELAHFICARALEGKQDNHTASAEYRLFLEESPNDPNAPRARAALAKLEK